ncbi:MAG TPA: flavin-dependent monooxygenase [Acidimicrobiales bacterium]|nr:flavin-dependent monooxygenase [Acidimicrobiales bacterium]
MGTLDRVRQLLPGLRERSPEGERLRRLPDDTVKELRETGLTRLLQPKRYGGDEAHPAEFFEAILEIAGACGSTGWVASVVGVHPWQIAHWDDKAQAEVWGEDPDTWVSSSYMPGGKLVPCEGGYRLSGRWSFSSGSDHCRWVILGTMVDRGEGNPPEPRNSLIPRSDYVIEDVWNTVGLRGTGSNDIVIEDLFVPEYRTLNLIEMFGWKSPGLAVNTSPLYRMPFATLFSYAITGPIIGMAEGMVTEAMEHTRKRVSNVWGKALEDPYTVAALGEASREVDACRLQLFRNLNDMYATVEGGGKLTMEQRARARRDQVLATQRCVAAIDDLFDRAGAQAILLAKPMQRIWRDAHAAKHHTINTLERALFSYAYVALGQNPTETMT